MPLPTVPLIEQLSRWAARRVGQALKKLRCSFCGTGQREVRKLVAGPRVYICDRCIEAGLAEDLAGKDATGTCTFCGRKAPVFRRATPAAICRPCLELSRDIVVESGG